MKRFNVDNPSDVRLLKQKSQTPRIFEVFPRDYDVGLVYGSSVAVGKGIVPVEDTPQVLVPRDSYKDVLKRCHEKKILPMYHQKHTWAPEGFRYNQNGLGYCASADTEVLTENGWVAWPDYDGRSKLATVNPQTHELQYQTPTAVQVFDHDGDMVYSNHRSMDYAFTPGHKMYVRKNRDKDYKFYQLGEITCTGSKYKFLDAPAGFNGTELVEVSVDQCYDGDDFIKLMAFITSDGWAQGENNKRFRSQVGFYCYDEARKPEADRLAAKYGFACYGPRYVKDSPKLHAWVVSNCYGSNALGSGNKKVPPIIKWSSSRQIQLFLVWYGDQVRDKPVSCYMSTSKGMIDDLQELLLKVGKRSVPSWQGSRSVSIKGKDTKGMPYCRLRVAMQGTTLRKGGTRTEYYKGKVYCATVDNHTLITRRNGHTTISSNCWTWSGTGCLMTTRAMEDKETVLLAPVSMGYLVGWANRGNFLEDFIEGARNRGICPAINGDINSHRNSASFWAQHEDKRSLYRLDKVWDTNPRAGDATMIQHCLSILAYGRSLYIAYNWWGHALECVGIRWDESEPNNIVWIIRNSHNEDDFIELTGSRGVPDEAYGFISTVAA